MIRVIGLAALIWYAIKPRKAKGHRIGTQKTIKGKTYRWGQPGGKGVYRWVRVKKK